MTKKSWKKRTLEITLNITLFIIQIPLDFLCFAIEFLFFCIEMLVMLLVFLTFIFIIGFVIVAVLYLLHTIATKTLP